MRSLVIAIITPVCRLGDWLITRYGNRLNGDDDAQWRTQTQLAQTMTANQPASATARLF